MIHCAGSYGVRVNGQTVWFKDYAEAARVEAEQLYRSFVNAINAGKLVIMTKEIAQKVEALRSGEHTPQSRSAD